MSRRYHSRSPKSPKTRWPSEPQAHSTGPLPGKFSPIPTWYSSSRAERANPVKPAAEPSDSDVLTTFGLNLGDHWLSNTKQANLRGIPRVDFSGGKRVFTLASEPDSVFCSVGFVNLLFLVGKK